MAAGADEGQAQQETVARRRYPLLERMARSERLCEALRLALARGYLESVRAVVMEEERLIVRAMEGIMRGGSAQQTWFELLAMAVKLDEVWLVQLMMVQMNALIESIAGVAGQRTDVVCGLWLRCLRALVRTRASMPEEAERLREHWERAGRSLMSDDHLMAVLQRQRMWHRVLDDAAVGAGIEAIRFLHQDMGAEITPRCLDNAAATQGALSVVEYLYQAGARPGVGAIDRAASHGCLAAVRWLALNTDSTFSEAAIDGAAATPNGLDIVEFLLACPTTARNSICPISASGVRTAAMRHDPSLLQLLLKHFQLMNTSSRDLRNFTGSAFHSAAAAGSLACVECMAPHVRGTARVSIAAQNAALGNAVRNGKLDVAEWLHGTFAGAALPKADLRAAIARGHLQTVRWASENVGALCTLALAGDAALSGHAPTLEYVLHQVVWGQAHSHAIADDVFVRLANRGMCDQLWLLARACHRNRYYSLVHSALRHRLACVSARCGNAGFLDILFREEVCSDAPTVGELDESAAVADGAGHASVAQWLRQKRHG